MREHAIHSRYMPWVIVITLFWHNGGEAGQANPPSKEDNLKTFSELEQQGNDKSDDNQKYKQHFEFQEKIRKLAEQKDYVQAINLLEGQYEKNVKEGFRFGEEQQEEVMAVLYEKAGRLEQGVNFLVNNRKTGKESKYKYEDTLFDLAIKAGRLDVAQSVANSENKADVEKLYFNAQLQAASGNVEECLRLVQEYLKYEFAEPGCQIIVRPRFGKMHGNPKFQALMVEAQEKVRKRQMKDRADREGTPQPKPFTFEEIQNIVSVFRTIKDPKAARAPSNEIQEAMRKIAPYAGNYKKELLELLRAEKESTYYRLMLAGMLAMVQAADLTGSVVEEVKNDDFRQFPDLLFRLAYLVARTSPRDAKPLLAQLLKASGSDLALPNHAMKMNWDMQLFQAYGVAEMECVDDLVKAAEQPGEEARSALRLLAMFQEPRVVPLLAQHIRHESQPEARKAMIELLGRVVLPESRKALETLVNEIQDKDIQGLLRQKAEKIKPPPAEMHPLKGGTAVLDPKMKDILFSNLCMTYGQDVSFIDKSISMSVSRDDIPRLRQLRSRIMFRMSDEGMYDYRTITSIITWLRWQP